MKIACNHSPRHDKNEEEKRDELLTRELDAFCDDEIFNMKWGSLAMIENCHKFISDSCSLFFSVVQNFFFRQLLNKIQNARSREGKFMMMDRFSSED